MDNLTLYKEFKNALDKDADWWISTCEAYNNCKLCPLNNNGIKECEK